MMVKEARLGIALLQEEGASSETLMASDLVFRNVLDFFACLKEPKRLVASLRS
jgi:soluble P-type ATPase